MPPALAVAAGADPGAGRLAASNAVSAGGPASVPAVPVDACVVASAPASVALASAALVPVVPVEVCVVAPAPASVVPPPAFMSVVADAPTPPAAAPSVVAS